MAWSIVINNLQDYQGFPQDVIETFLAGHVAYPFDAQLALIAAKEAGLASATLAGARTPNPYGGDEVVDIAVHGFAEHKDLAEFMKAVVVQPESHDNPQS